VSRKLDLRVEAARCTRCGACSALSPSLFDVSAGACRVVRQPIASEHRIAEAARWICPTDAIRATASDGDEDDVAAQAVQPSGPIFDELAAGAEAVRWTLAALPWGDLDPVLAPAGLRLVVREMAFSENATYSATQRFLDAFGDEVDFSRWVAVWFYEETRHPGVLIEWLRRVGEPLPDDFVTNVVSEITAAQAYRYLARTSPEPVLGGLAARIAGDEARHAASFFRFARQKLASTPEASVLRECSRGLEVLHAWLDGAQKVTHPVQQMIERLGMAPTDGSFELDFEAIRIRVVRVVGLLLDVPLRRADDVAPALREMLGRARGRTETAG
jgi:ferredoxin